MPQSFSVTMDIREFETAAKRLLKELPQLTKKEIATAIMLEWLRRIILRWPVDLGRSRAGWGLAFQTLGGDYVPAGSSAEAQSEGFALGFLDDASQGKRIVLRAVNAVDYAIYLEEGSSDQAPAGAVFISLQEIITGRIPQEAFQIIQKRWEQLGVEANTRNITRALSVRGRR